MDPVETLQLPPGWQAELEARGWEYRGANHNYVFFQQPGYWLRVFCRGGSGTFMASIRPVPYHVPDGKWPPTPFTTDELAPVFTGKGAMRRALEHAAKLWQTHDAYLQPIGIRLHHVGVNQYSAVGGAGSEVAAKFYYRRDVARLLNRPQGAKLYAEQRRSGQKGESEAWQRLPGGPWTDIQRAKKVCRQWLNAEPNNAHRTDFRLVWDDARSTIEAVSRAPHGSHMQWREPC
jgi:hypothetical protein